MIFADKLIDLRKKAGWSQEELAEQLDVSRQSVSKWEEAQSVPDMAKILRLSALFGVSTDYLLKDELSPEPYDAASMPEMAVAAIPVSMEEASAFLAMKEKNAAQIALGVLLCVLSPVLLILLGGAWEYGKIAITQDQAGGLGLIVLMLLIGGAVALFLRSGFRIRKYEALEKEPIDPLYGVSGMVQERREQFRPVFARQMTIGIILCVLAVVPIGISLLIAGEDEYYHVIAAASMLALIAVGVMLIVRVSVIWGGFQILMEEGDYSREAKKNQKQLADFSRIYWLAVTAGYLGWSFYSDHWVRTWIVWPVAAVGYGAVFAVAKALKRKN